MRKRKQNPKRRIGEDIDATELELLSRRVVYVGSQLHKRHLGDFELAPPAQPRLNKSLCDGVKIDREQAQRLLKTGGEIRGKRPDF